MKEQGSSRGGLLGTCLDGNCPAGLLVEVQALADEVAHAESSRMQESHWDGQIHSLSPVTQPHRQQSLSLTLVHTP